MRVRVREGVRILKRNGRMSYNHIRISLSLNVRLAASKHYSVYFKLASILCSLSNY